MKHITVPKGEIIQRKKDLNSKAYKVVSGLLRSYTIDAKGKEHIFLFAPEGWIIADNVPPENPCDLFIDAVEDSKVIQLEKDLLTKHSEQDVQKLLNRLRVLQNRIILLLSASAIERYEHFLITYPEVVQRVPQRMIASYLGITPETLSTVKNMRHGKS